jgi:polysaccharide biosynthesis transport protein
MDKNLFSSFKNYLNSPYQSVASSNLVSNPEEDDRSLDMNWVVAVVKRRLLVMFVASATIATLSGSLILWNARKIISEYEGKFTVLVEPVTSDDQLTNLFVQAQNNSLGVTELSKIKSSSHENYSVDYQSLTRVLKSPEVLTPLFQKLQGTYPKFDYKNLFNNLNIERITFTQDGKEAGTKLLQISYRDRDASRIKNILETALEYYMDYMRQERLSVKNRGMNFIDQQIPQLQQKVDKLQKELESLRAKYNFNQPEVSSRLLSEQMSSLTNSRVEVQAQLAQNRQQYETYQQRYASGDSRWISEINSKSYEGLMAKVNEIDLQASVTASQFYEDTSPVKSLRNKQQILHDFMRKEAASVLLQMKGQIQQLEARDRVLANNQKILQDKITTMPQAQSRYDGIQLELELAKAHLKLFLDKQKTLQLDANGIDNSWKVIAKPELVRDNNGNLRSVQPKPTRRHLTIALVISSLLGIAIGFLVEVLNTVFHTPGEVKSATKRPVLGIIPFAKSISIKARRSASIPANLTSITSTTNNTSFRPITFSDYPDSFSLEPFYSLYANIQLLSAERPINSVSITSTVKGEGKSTIAVNLAKTAAAVGKRVLLVDANMRFPQLHKYLDLSNIRGLSNALTSDLSLNETIQRVPGNDNLFALTAGSTLSDPIKLISAPKMQYLIEQFLGLFDLVIYDTPHLSGLADGHLLASKTQGTLMVVKMEKTDRDMVSQVLEQLNVADINVFGVVANGMKGQ